MKKTAIITLLAALLAAAIITFGAQTGTTGYVGAEWIPPATTALATERTAESVSAESAAEAGATEESGAAYAETETCTTAATMRPPTTAVPTTSPTTTAARSTTTAPAPTTAPVVPTPATAAQTTTTTRYVPPQTAAATAAASPGTDNPWFVPAESPGPLPVVRNTGEYETLGPEYAARMLAGQTKRRAEHGLAPMTMDPELTAYAQAHAMRMAQEGRNFHSEQPPGGESTGYFVYTANPPDVIGELLTTHVHNFLEAAFTTTGIGAVRSGNYVYVVMLCR